MRGDAILRLVDRTSTDKAGKTGSCAMRIMDELC